VFDIRPEVPEITFYEVTEKAHGLSRRLLPVLKQRKQLIVDKRLDFRPPRVRGRDHLRPLFQ
jgi:hypothetical protein